MPVTLITTTLSGPLSIENDIFQSSRNKNLNRKDTINPKYICKQYAVALRIGALPRSGGVMHIFCHSIAFYFQGQ
jgi:hypothetical protein